MATKADELCKRYGRGEIDIYILEKELDRLADSGELERTAFSLHETIIKLINKTKMKHPPAFNGTNLLLGIIIVLAPLGWLFLSPETFPGIPGAWGMVIWMIAGVWIMEISFGWSGHTEDWH